jgi:hypothetical protein
VLDNADDKKVFFDASPQAPSQQSGQQLEALVKYLPRSSNDSMLITTRDKKVEESLMYRMKPIKVLPFGLEEAQQLMRNTIVPNND